MAVPFSNTKLRVPRGFQNVMWVFAREVMRDDPKDIIEYGSEFFKKLLQIRALEGHDPAEHGAHSEDRFYNNWSYKESAAKKGLPTDEELDLADPNLADAASKIQAQFKGYLVRKQLEAQGISIHHKQHDDIDFSDPAVEHAAVLIQAQYKGYRVRKEFQNLYVHSGILQRDTAEYAAPPEQGMEEIDIDLSDPAVQEAAVKIQAQFKGFMTRKLIREGSLDVTHHPDEHPAEEPPPETVAEEPPPEAEAPPPEAVAEEPPPEAEAQAEEEVDIDLNDPAVAEAAVKIQAQFKGFMARKELDRRRSEDQKPDGE